MNGRHASVPEVDYRRHTLRCIRMPGGAESWKLQGRLYRAGLQNSTSLRHIFSNSTHRTEQHRRSRDHWTRRTRKAAGLAWKSYTDVRLFVERRRRRGVGGVSGQEIGVADSDARGLWRVSDEHGLDAPRQIQRGSVYHEEVAANQNTPSMFSTNAGTAVVVAIARRSHVQPFCRTACLLLH